MVRVRRVVLTAKCSVRLDQTQVGQEHIRAEDKPAELDVKIHGGATVTCCQYKQSVEPEGRRRTGAERVEQCGAVQRAEQCSARRSAEEHESKARCIC